MLQLLWDHPYITSEYFSTFSKPPTPYVCMKTVVNVSKNGHFLTPPYKLLRDIWMVPRVKKIDEILWKMYIVHGVCWVVRTVQYRRAVGTDGGREWQSQHLISAEIEA